VPDGSKSFAMLMYDPEGRPPSGGSALAIIPVHARPPTPRRIIIHSCS
jgi:hypothetical protein